LTITMNNDLMQKLALSKKIMDASDKIKPGQTQGGLPMTENINATYNIPQDMVQQPVPQQPTQQMVQTQQMSQPQPVTESKIQNSKLPDEIKQLMMEHPIQQPSFGGGSGTVLSDDVIEGAQRLMGNTPNQTVNESVNIPTTNNSDLKQMIRDVVRDTVRDVVREELQSAGMIMEGNTKTNDSLQLRVGKHVFEGKVTKIKKVK
jgi:cation transport regulator ChaB